MRMKPSHRGILAVVSWAAWPVLYFNCYWFISVILATGRRCSIEGCDPPRGLAGAVWWFGLLAVPAVLTYRWFRQRNANH